MLLNFLVRWRCVRFLLLLLFLGPIALIGCSPSAEDGSRAGGSAPREALLHAAVRVEPGAASHRGWGVLLDGQQGLVLTTEPTVDGREEIEVTSADPAVGGRTSGRVVFRDPDCGLAVIRLDRTPDGLVPLPFGDDTYRAGQILHTLHESDGPAAHRGLIRHIVQVPHLCGAGPKVIPWVIAIDPSGSFGPAGAPVIDEDGRLVGMVAASDDVKPGPAWLFGLPAMRDALAGRRGPPEPPCPAPAQQ